MPAELSTSSQDIGTTLEQPYHRRAERACAKRRARLPRAMGADGDWLRWADTPISIAACLANREDVWAILLTLGSVK